MLKEAGSLKKQRDVPLQKANAQKLTPSHIYITHELYNTQAEFTVDWSVSLCSYKLRYVKWPTDAFALFANATASALRTVNYFAQSSQNLYHFKKLKIAFALENQPPKSSSF